MKKIIILLAVMAVAAIAIAKEKDPFKGWNKLDIGTRNIYKADSTSEEWADVIIKVMPPVKPRQMKKLEKAGFKPSAVMNIIMTGKIQMSHLEKFTDIPFVLYVEAAAPLSEKKEQIKGKR